MYKLIFTFLIFFSINNFTCAKTFTNDHQVKVINLDDKKIELLVTKTEDDIEGFPEATKLYGTINKHTDRKHFMRDEYLLVDLYQAKLSDGSSEALNQQIKIQPRKWLSNKNYGTALIATTGTVLGLTLDVLTIGFPVARGGKALWESGFSVYNTPKDKSKLKAGTLGFIKGALFPLPELILKGETLNLHQGSSLKIHDSETNKNTAVLIKRLN